MKKMSGVSEAYTYNIEYFRIIFPFLFIFVLYIEFVVLCAIVLCYFLQYGPEETCSELYGGMTIKKSLASLTTFSCLNNFYSMFSFHISSKS